MHFFSKIFHFVLNTVYKYNIDESHGLGHSMNCLYYSNQIYEQEVKLHPEIKEHENMIYISAALHDMCDRKYMNKEEGMKNITKFIEELQKDGEPILKNEECKIVEKIISTMSYSYVKEHGLPNMGTYQTAYNIVREADLLCAYDFDRCMMYNMHQLNGNVEIAFQEAVHLFEKRMFKHNEDGLYCTQYSKLNFPLLEYQTQCRIAFWRKMLRIT